MRDSEADTGADTPAGRETVFTWAGPALKFGVGAVAEIGYDVAQLGASRVLVLTDPGVAATGVPTGSSTACARPVSRPSSSPVFTWSPPTGSIAAAVDFAREGAAVGRASSASAAARAIDTAKAVDLLTSQPRPTCPTT